MSSSDALDAEAHATAVENVKPNIGRTTSKSAKNSDKLDHTCVFHPHTPVACAVDQKFKNKYLATEDNIVAATEASLQLMGRSEFQVRITSSSSKIKKDQQFWVYFTNTFLRFSQTSFTVNINMILSSYFPTCFVHRSHILDLERAVIHLPFMHLPLDFWYIYP